MWRTVVVALISLGLLVLTTLTLAPAQATATDSEVYFWGYSYPNTDQLVCKKVVTHPAESVKSGSSNRPAVKMYSQSLVVGDRYCADFAKPEFGKL